MKLYKQDESSNSGFKFLEVTNEGCKLNKKSVSEGGKIIETVKEYKDEKKAINALERYRAEQIAEGYFECEGDYRGPILSAPLGLGEAPEDFSERLEKLEMNGILLFAHHHHSYELETCLPVEKIFMESQEVNEHPAELLKHRIKKSTKLVEYLDWYAKFDRDLMSMSKSEWQDRFTEEINDNQSSWNALAADTSSLGAYSTITNGISIGILQSKLLKNQIGSEVVIELTPNTEDFLENMGFFDFDEFSSDLVTPLALLCIDNSAKLLAEIRAWLFSGYEITQYDLTSSTMYMEFRRPFAMRLIMAKNTSCGKIYTYFYHMQFDS